MDNNTCRNGSVGGGILDVATGAPDIRPDRMLNLTYQIPIVTEWKTIPAAIAL